MDSLETTANAFNSMRLSIHASVNVYRALLRQLEGMAAHQEVPTVHRILIDDLRSTIEVGQTVDASLLAAIHAIRRGDRAVRVSQSLVALGNAYTDYVATVINSQYHA